MLLQREMVYSIQLCAWIGASFCISRAATVVELQHMAHGGMPDGVIRPQARAVAVSPDPKRAGQCPLLATASPSMFRHGFSDCDVVSSHAGFAGVATRPPTMLPKCCCSRKWHSSFDSLLGLGPLSSVMMLELLRTASTWQVAACLTVSSFHEQLPSDLAQRGVVSAHCWRQQAPACCGMASSTAT